MSEFSQTPKQNCERFLLQLTLGSPLDVVAYVLDCDIVVREFELEARSLSD